MSQIKKQKNKLNIQMRETKMNPLIKHSKIKTMNTIVLNSKSEEISEIDDEINEKKKYFSKSTIESYIPLSRIEKEKKLAEISEHSEQRFKRYSNIFDEIKKQIYDINSNLLKNEGNIDLIEEQEEEYLITPNTIRNSKRKMNRNVNFNYTERMDTNDIDDFIDMNSLKENKGQIVLSNTKENESMIKTKMKNRNQQIDGLVMPRTHRPTITQLKKRPFQIDLLKQNDIKELKVKEEKKYHDVYSEEYDNEFCNCNIY